MLNLAIVYLLLQPLQVLTDSVNHIIKRSSREDLVQNVTEDTTTAQDSGEETSQLRVPILNPMQQYPVPAQAQLNVEPLGGLNSLEKLRVVGCYPWELVLPTYLPE